MDNVKDDSYYLNRILADIDFILEHVKGVSEEEMVQNEVLLDSMQFRIIQISESGSKLSRQFKDRHPEIKWYEISGMRNWIVHDYGNVNYSVVYSALTNDILPLRNKLLKEG